MRWAIPTVLTRYMLNEQMLKLVQPKVQPKWERVKLFIIILAVLALAAPATAAAPQARDPRVPALQPQVAALSGQVAALNGQMSRVNDKADCYYIKNLDLNIGLTNVVSAIVTALTGTSYPEIQPASDNGACARAGISPPRSLHTLGLTTMQRQVEALRALSAGR